MIKMEHKSIFFLKKKELYYEHLKPKYTQNCADKQQHQQQHNNNNIIDSSNDAVTHFILAPKTLMVE